MAQAFAHPLTSKGQDSRAPTVLPVTFPARAPDAIKGFGRIPNRRNERGPISGAGLLGSLRPFATSGVFYGGPPSLRGVAIEPSLNPSSKPTGPPTGITLFRRWLPPGASDGGFELSLKSSRG